MCIVLASKAILTKNNVPITTSLKVAEYFKRKHKNVVLDILKLKEEDKEDNDGFWGLHFWPSEYKSRGKKNIMYCMTEDGFMFLAMGYTGKKARRIKKSFINAFREMIILIKSRLESKVEHHLFAQAIASNHQFPKSYHFSNEYNMIYRIMFGMSGKKYKEVNGYVDGETIKEILDDQEVHRLMQLQKLDEALIAADIDYQGRKQQLTEFYKNMLTKQLSKVGI